MNKPELPQNTCTCITCCVAFKNGDLQRDHYKTDWHRYNLKRKVSDLPPVTAEDFQQKILNQRAVDQLANQDKSVYCNICRKSFGNPNAYDNHLNSKKHKENEKTFDGSERVSKISETSEMEIEEEEVDSDEWNEDSENPMDNNDCMFCLHHSKNFIKNLEHMTNCHSFFIPDIEYCTDVFGLLQYLSRKISEGFMCLWCNEKGRSFHSADAVRKHMIDKGHCKILHEGEALLEYTDFYDYSASYPDAEKHDPDEEVAVPELESSEYQLVLPSGSVIGHRSLMRYYKQSLNPEAVVLHSNSVKKMNKLLSSYRSLGWLETNKEITAKKARDIYYMKKMQAKFSLLLGVKGNKMQKHFRPQVNF